MKTPSVILSHAGVQYSYQIAAALQESEMLETFWTTLYSARPWNQVPGLKQLLRRRYYRGLDPKHVRAYPWPEMIQRGALMLWRWDNAARNRLVDWRNRRFDRHVARDLPYRDYDLFVGLSGACLESLKAAKKMGKKAVVDQHDIHFEAAREILASEIAAHPEFASSIPYWPPLESYLDRVREELEIADAILVPSTYALQTHLDHGIAREKLILMPHGLNAFSERGYLKRVPDRTFRVLFLGQLTQRKGLKYLLEAVKDLNVPNMELVLAGDDMLERGALDPYAAFVRKAGYVPHAELPAYFAQADALVLPSLYDAFGLAALEAMAAGVPVIVSDHIAAGSDVVRDGVDGFVVGIRDSKAITARLRELYQHPDLRERIGRQAVERVRSFSWETYKICLRNALKHLGMKTAGESVHAS